MGYSSQADVAQASGGTERLRQLADFDNSNDAVAITSNVTSAIAAADALIDSYINKRYRVPVSPVPLVIQTTSAELARLIIARRRGMPTEDEQRRWGEIAGDKGWLYQVATGVVTLGIEPVPTASEMQLDTVEQPTSNRAEDRAGYEGFF